MISTEEIQVIDLLRQREAELVKVWECEEGIRALLGVKDFPYPAVPDLPSRRKPLKGASRRVPMRKGAASSENAVAGREKPVPALRGLVGDENAYRLEFESRGRLESSFQIDLEGIKRLFNVECPEMKLRRVETVAFTSVEEWQRREVLWTAQAAEDK